jgi:diacylglycerol kinase (ATP)
MMRVLLFANPIAGRGRGGRIAAALQEVLGRGGIDVRVFLQRADRIDPTALRDAVGDDIARSAAISIGGDGTLRGVAEALVGAFAPGSPRDARDDNSVIVTNLIPPLLVVPLGTANLMGKHLGVDWHRRRFEEAVLDAIRRRQTVRLDAARADGKIFLLMAGIGIDAAVVHQLARVRKGPIDLSSYVVPAALALGNYRYPPLRVIVDGAEVFPMSPGMAFIGNVPEYGTGFPILPMAKSDDGLLDVCVLPCASPQEAIHLVLQAAAGEHVNAEGVVYTKGKRVRVESSQRIPVQVDGDAAGHTPVEIDLLPLRLPFIVP